MIKKIKLTDATEEQIANCFDMCPENFGITFPAYDTQCTSIEVDKDGDYIEVGLKGVMNLVNPYYVNGGEADATLTVRLTNINWDAEIEVE